MCLKYQGPNSNLVELTPGTENEMRVENLELLLKCDTLSKGGKQKHGVLAHCREHDGLKEFSHEFFWRLSLCVSDLAKVITRGMDYDDELKGGKQPDFEDKRTYSEFLRILRETYETLPEKDPEHLCGPRRGRKIGKVEKTITKEMATMLVHLHFMVHRTHRHSGAWTMRFCMNHGNRVSVLSSEFFHH